MTYIGDVGSYISGVKMQSEPETANVDAIIELEFGDSKLISGILLGILTAELDERRKKILLEKLAWWNK